MSMTAAELLEAALDGTLQDDDAPTEQPDASTEGVPAAAAPEGQDEQKAGNAETEVEGAPILSKSGAYTIPYEKLAEAREARKAAQDRIAQLEQQVAELTGAQRQNLAAVQADAQDRANAGQAQTATDANLEAAAQAISEGVDLSIFGDFSEEDRAKGVAELSRRSMAQVEQRLMAVLDDRLSAPLRAQEAKTATSAHYDTIYGAHPDADEIVESAEFAAWRDRQPAFAKAGIEHAMTKGSAQDVVEVFNAFRGTKPQQPSTARTAPEAPARRVPNSLSDVPGAAPMDKTQQILAAAGNAEALLDSMGSLTPEQRDALLDNLI